MLATRPGTEHNLLRLRGQKWSGHSRVDLGDRSTAREPYEESLRDILPSSVHNRLKDLSIQPCHRMHTRSRLNMHMCGEASAFNRAI